MCSKDARAIKVVKHFDHAAVFEHGHIYQLRLVGPMKCVSHKRKQRALTGQLIYMATKWVWGGGVGQMLWSW